MLKIYFKTARDSTMHELDTAKSGAWIDVSTPSNKDIEQLSALLNLDVSTLRDALDPYEAPRIALDESDVYIFTRYCRPYHETSSTEPLLILFTEKHVVTVSLNKNDIVEKLIEKSPTTTQKTKLVLELLTLINEGYRSYIDEITRTIFKLRTELTRTQLSNEDFLRVIDIEEDLNEMLTSLQPYSMVIESLFTGRHIALHANDQELIEDIKLSTSELIDLTRSRLRTLENLRDVYNTITTNTLNNTFKRLTSITIFLAIPTVLGGIYGMNVRLPLEGHKHAFFAMIALMLFSVGTAIIIFKRKRWL